MIFLCASHIDSKKRFNKLKRAIKSIKYDHIYISISYEPPYEKHVLNLKHNHKFIWPFKLSQFEHYNLLSQELIKENISRDTWCLFFDDDDICHKLRKDVYQHFISDNSVVYIQYSAIHYDSVNKKYSKCSQEYFDFACTLEVMLTFFKYVQKDILKNIGCDLLFRNFMRSLPCTIILHSEWIKHYHVKWLYKHIMSLKESHSTFIVDMEKLSNIWTYTLTPIFTKNIPNFDGSMKLFKNLL